jgi:hypothetical protein
MAESRFLSAGDDDAERPAVNILALAFEKARASVWADLERERVNMEQLA